MLSLHTSDKENNAMLALPPRLQENGQCASPSIRELKKRQTKDFDAFDAKAPPDESSFEQPPAAPAADAPDGRPLADRLTDKKNWRARKDATDELVGLLDAADSKDDPIFTEYGESASPSWSRRF